MDVIGTDPLFRIFTTIILEPAFTGADAGETQVMKASRAGDVNSNAPGSGLAPRAAPRKSCAMPRLVHMLLIPSARGVKSPEAGPVNRGSTLRLCKSKFGVAACQEARVGYDT